MQMIGLRDIALDYAKTLQHWQEGFLAELDDVKSMGFDEKFIRMWRFYLCYCEGGFRERIIGTYQITMAKPSTGLHNLCFYRLLRLPYLSCPCSQRFNYLGLTLPMGRIR